MNIVHKARLFATAAHAAVGQKRKYTGEPYIVHPAEAVIAILLALGGAILMIKDPIAGAILTATSCWLLFKD